MILLSGTFLVLWSTHYAVILTVRLLTGTSHGIVYVTLICHGSENSYSQVRGRQLSNIVVMGNVGSIVAAVTTITYNHLQLETRELLIGIFTIVYAAVGTILIWYYGYESIVHLLQLGSDSEALEVMVKLRRDAEESPELQKEFSELRTHVAEDFNETTNIFANGNVKPLFVLLCVRFMAICSNNVLLNTILIAAVYVSLIDLIDIIYVPLALVICRTIGSLIGNILSDKYKRNLSISLIGGFAGVVLLVFAILFLIINIGIAFVWLLIVYQVLVGYSVDVVQLIVNGEAFALNKKRWSITVIVIVEQILHVTAMYVGFYVSLTVATVNSILLVSSIGIVASATIMYFMLPDTLSRSLRWCRDAYR